MSKPIITTRILKNTETGIDVSIPEYRTVSKLLSTEEEFHVIIITDLLHFKTEDFKPEDVVQFMIPKWYSDFEALHRAMSERYPATIFPDLPKKVLMVKDSTPQQRRAKFEKLLQFIAASPKVYNSPIFLKFLGVQQSKIDSIDGKGAESTTAEDGETKDVEAATKSPTKSVKSQSSSLFGDEDSDDELFKTDKAGVLEEDEDEPDSDLFSPSPHHTPAHTNGKSDELILDVDDQAVSNTELHESLFLSPGVAADVTSSEILRLAEEDNSDLLNVDDDLDKLLNISGKPTPPTKPATAPETSGAKSPTKPLIKPRSAPKPGAKSAPKSNVPETLGALDQSSGEAGLMAEDDIMKYIQDNAESGDAKLDLF